MISLVRNRLGIPGLIAIIAMVFAMGGAAYAAKKYVITSTSQIKPSVLKKLKGKRGPQGPAGTNGTNGKDGANGINGAPGAPGADGASVALLNESPANCTEGGFTYEVEGSGEENEVCNGSPWTGGGVLPAGKTETGTYGVIGHFVKNYSENGSGELESTTSASPMTAPISFTLPVDPAPTVVYVADGGSDPNCPGIQGGVATAESGFLCVYEAKETNPNQPTPFFSPGMTFGEALGADPMGTVGFTECNAATCTWVGAWAVTAE